MKVEVPVVCYSCSNVLPEEHDTYKGLDLCWMCYKAVATKKALELVDDETQKRLDEMSREVMSAKSMVEAQDKKYAEIIDKLEAQVLERDEYIAELLSDEAVLAEEKWKRKLG